MKVSFLTEFHNLVIYLFLLKVIFSKTIKIQNTKYSIKQTLHKLWNQIQIVKH